MRTAACLLVFGLFGAPGVPPTARSSSPAVAAPVALRIYQVPLSGPMRIVRPFVAPTTQYGPGHRGVDLASREGQTVFAAAAGTVTFAGLVAGRGVVVVVHPDGVRTEYEPVTASVSAGAVVTGGEPIGVAHGIHAGCAAASCLHWGARRGDVYFDPLTLLQPLGVVRLLPLTG